MRVWVLDQQVTEIRIPIVEVGQVRGRVFIDQNGNDKPDDGEIGPPGRTLVLFNESVRFETRSAIFGAYAFDLVPIGKYTLSAGNRTYNVTISREQKFVVIDVPLSE